MDPEAQVNARPLENKTACIKFKDISLALKLTFTPEKIHVSEPDECSDVSIEATSLVFLKQAILKEGKNPDIEIAGDMQLAIALNAFFRKIDIDWEDILSQITGDMVAHQVGGFARSAVDFVTETKDTLVEDVADYVKEETKLLPTRVETNRFFDDVSTLRDDVERLETKIL